MARYKLLAGPNDNYFGVIIRKKTSEGYAFVNSGDTVEVTLYSETTGDPVVGGAWPLGMVYAEGSNGLWECTFQNALDLTAQANYYALVNIDAEGLQRLRRFDFTAVRG